MKKLNALVSGMLSALMLLVLVPQAHAGEWDIDHYEWSGTQHSESLTKNQAMPGRYHMTVTSRDQAGNERPWPISSASVGWWYDSYATPGHGPYPNQTNYLGAPPVTLNGTLSSSVIAVFKWQRNQLWDMQLVNYDGEEYWEEYYYDDPDDNPTPLYILERSTL